MLVHSQPHTHSGAGQSYCVRVGQRGVATRLPRAFPPAAADRLSHRRLPLSGRPFGLCLGVGPCEAAAPVGRIREVQKRVWRHASFVSGRQTYVHNLREGGERNAQQQVQIEKCLLAIQRYQLCYSYSESNCRGKSSIEGPWRTNKILCSCHCTEFVSSQLTKYFFCYTHILFHILSPS